jgi:shikimate dehydrogenase
MRKNSKLLLSLNNLKVTAIVYDIVYKPLITDLLHNAIKRGNPIVTGIGMLIRQALVGFNMWYGVLVKDTNDIEKLLTSNNL